MPKKACNLLVNEILMTGMNRLSPLIVRRVGPSLAVTGRGGMRSLAGSAVTASVSQSDLFGGVDAAGWLEDLKLFATGWIGGLIFFGTLLG